MTLSAKIRKISEAALDLGIILIEDTIESLSSDESRTGLQKRLRDNADRAAQLALDVARLEDENLSLRTMNPSITSNESYAIRYAIRFIDQHGSHEDDDVVSYLAELHDRSDINFGHFDPPPGYLQCTIPWPHGDGPCAHPIAKDMDDDFPF